MSTSTSSASGNTVTATEEVCTRPWDSVTGIALHSQCGPPSCLRRRQASGTFDQEGHFVDAAEIGRLDFEHLGLESREWSA